VSILDGKVSRGVAGSWRTIPGRQKATAAP
jgi:hypothetical protein